MEVLTVIFLLWALFVTSWLIVMVFSFEHQNAVEIHDLITDAYRAIKLDDDMTATTKLALASGSLRGTFFHYPWTRPRTNLIKAIYHPEIDQ